MKTWISTWNGIRLLKVIIGIVVCIQGALVYEWGIFIAGCIVTFMALANKGCNNNSCSKTY